MPRPAATCGAYIAWHPWLAQVATAMGKPLIVKVGHSSRLGGRLLDSAYTTCWGLGWRYLMTFEVETKQEAQAIEEGCLHSLKHYRVDGREMVFLPTADVGNLRQLLTDVSEALKIKGALVDAPEYESPPPAPACESPEDAEQVRIRRQIEKFPVMRPPAEVGGEAEASKPTCPDFEERTPRSESIIGGKSSASEIVAAVRVSGFGRGASADPSSPAALEKRKYQEDAAEACLCELGRVGKTTLIMACRCGKTRVAHMVMERWGCGRPDGKVILFLVPWLALVRQTVDKLCSYGVEPGNILMVGSGGNSAPAPENDPLPDDGSLQECAEPLPHHQKMTTSPHEVQARIQHARSSNASLVVVSTYYSAHAALGPETRFDLTVYDECHHVCGASIKPVEEGTAAATDRQSSFALLVPESQTGPRLFMTATPEYRKGGVNMSDKTVFGGVAYRYHLRQGIEAGYVNDFEIQLVASSQDAASRLDLLRTKPAAQSGQFSTWNMWKRFLSLMSSVFGQGMNPAAAATAPFETVSPQGGTLMMAAQVGLAFAHLVSVPGRKKLLVFCRTIAEAHTLMRCVKFLLENAHELAIPEGPARQAVVSTASSQTSKVELTRVLREFYNPESYGILFNCKLFQEGIEFPPLNGVFFATPRHSSRDIVQSMCRALTRVEDKPQSVVYIPVPAVTSPEAPLGRFETLLPFAEAIYSEDPRFYEHLLDPDKPYPLGWLGAYGGAASLLQAARRAIRYGVKAPGKSGRLIDRLMKNNILPWEKAYQELARIVHVCRRYPKGNDGFSFSMAKEIAADGSVGDVKVLNFGAWYEWVKKEYVRYSEGAASALQPHQVRDLEALPEWKTRGVGGPYPPEECMMALDNILQSTGGQMPPVNVCDGGWIGLNATPLERLSGFLTTISQGDGRARSKTSKNRGFNVSSEKARLLDQVFGKWGLQWRKDRWYPVEELDAVIQSGKAATREAAALYLRDNGQPGFLYTHTTSSGKDGEYCGRRTVIQLAHEAFMAMAKANPNDPYVQQHWPGFPLKHKHMELDDVWEKGLAPPRHAKGKLITRAA